MRITVWQFLGLLLLLGAIWAGYHFWWSGQDRAEWIKKLNQNALESESERKKAEQPQEEERPPGWI